MDSAIYACESRVRILFYAFSAVIFFTFILTSHTGAPVRVMLKSLDPRITYNLSTTADGHLSTVLAGDKQKVKSLLVQTYKPGIWYLSSLHAVAHRDTCFSNSGDVYTAIPRQVGKETSREFSCDMVKGSGELMNFARYACSGVEKTRADDSCSFVNFSSKLHKYSTWCYPPRHTSTTTSDNSNLSVYLSEIHANYNIGHASRDTLFLAHVLRHFVVDDIFIRKLRKPPNEHRQRVISILAASVQPSPRIHWFTETSGGDEVKCPKVALEKAITFPGDVLAKRFVRDKTYEYCGIAENTIPSEVLIEKHHASREWAPNSVKYLINSVLNRTWASDSIVRAMSFHNLTFCEQVHAFARSRVVIAHHGAVVQGNGIFLQDEAVLVEIVSQFTLGQPDFSFNDIFQPSGVTGFADALSIRALSANVAYAANNVIDYYHTHHPVFVNESRWNLVLDQLDSFF